MLEAEELNPPPLFEEELWSPERVGAWLFHYLRDMLVEFYVPIQIYIICFVQILFLPGMELARRWFL